MHSGSNRHLSTAETSSLFYSQRHKGWQQLVGLCGNILPTMWPRAKKDVDSYWLSFWKLLRVNPFWALWWQTDGFVLLSCRVQSPRRVDSDRKMWFTVGWEPEAVFTRPCHVLSVSFSAPGIRLFSDRGSFYIHYDTYELKSRLFQTCHILLKPLFGLTLTGLLKPSVNLTLIAYFQGS